MRTSLSLAGSDLVLIQNQKAPQCSLQLGWTPERAARQPRCAQTCPIAAPSRRPGTARATCWAGCRRCRSRDGSPRPLARRAQAHDDPSGQRNPHGRGVNHPPGSRPVADRSGGCSSSETPSRRPSDHRFSSRSSASAQVRRSAYRRRCWARSNEASICSWTVATAAEAPCRRRAPSAVRV